MIAWRCQDGARNHVTQTFVLVASRCAIAASAVSRLCGVHARAVAHAARAPRRGWPHRVLVRHAVRAWCVRARAVSSSCGWCALLHRRGMGEPLVQDVGVGAPRGQRHMRPQRRRRADDGRRGVRGGRARPGRGAWEERCVAADLHVFCPRGLYPGDDDRGVSPIFVGRLKPNTERQTTYLRVGHAKAITMHCATLRYFSNTPEP